MSYYVALLFGNMVVYKVRQKRRRISTTPTVILNFLPDFTNKHTRRMHQACRLFTCSQVFRGKFDMGKNRYRPDQDGTHRLQFERNKKKILATQEICGICGKPVDKSLKYPHPLSPVIDHIIPIAKGGHPSDIDNLQLAHWTCNRQKSDKLIMRKEVDKPEVISNRVLPQSMDWKNYKARN